MKKAEEKLIGWLIVIGLICYFFTWLYENIGGFGIGLIAAVSIGSGIFANIYNTKKKQKAFDDLARHVLHNRLHPDEIKGVHNKLYKSDFPRAALIRNLQIIRDSIEIALSSKKRDTAESRMDLLLERYGDIKNEQSHLVSPEVFAEISAVIQETETDFNTNLYLNIASAHLEKAESLKTNKSKEKYINLAKEILDEGITIGKGNTSEFKRLLTKVEQEKDKITKSST